MQFRTFVSAAAASAMLMLPAPATAQETGVMNPNTNSQMTAMDVTRAIEDELLFDPGVPSDKVTVEVVTGIATLTGTVNNLLAKERATLITETVKGVESVVNRMVVEPTVDRSPEALRSDVTDALLTDPATDAYELDVHVDAEGAVTLSGTVESWPEYRLSEQVAKGVAGVTAVLNAIEVRSTSSRPDAEIQHEIEQSLYWSNLVDDGLIDVTVTDGVVSLTGTVGSAAEKRQAELKAWTAGVSAVEADDLTVAAWAEDAHRRKTTHVARSDADIASAIDRALILDPRVDSARVAVTVSGGMVTLRGTVADVKARRAALADARHTVGVINVRDRMHVDIPPRADAATADAIRAALTRNPFIERHDLTVSVLGGTAYLYGVVDDFFEKGLADDVVASVAGVSQVENNLTVRSGDWVGYDPFVGSPYFYGFDWYDYAPRHTWMPDDQIAQEIESQLWWSPFVDADQVHVEVEDGIATLTGTVDSWSEYRAAAENAYEGGAILVDNDLVVITNR